MPNINNEVWNLIAQDVALQKDLKRGVINNRALAKFLIEEHRLHYSLDAVLSAVRRFKDNNEKENSNVLDSQMDDVVIMTKNNITAITLKDKAFVNIANDYLTHRLLKKNFRMFKAKETIKIFVNQKDLDDKLEAFPKDYVKQVTRDLCEIRIDMKHDMSQIKGSLSQITGELALHDVVLIDVIVAPKEVLLYVLEKDLIRAQQALLGMKKRKK